MDFFNQPLCLGDRVVFVTNRGILKRAEIVEFYDRHGHQIARLYTEGKRYTEARCGQLIKDVSQL